MFCLLLLSAKYVLAQIKSVCACVPVEVGHFFSQDVVIWVRPDWNDKPRAAVLYQRYVIQQTFCFRCHGFLQLRYSNPSQTKQCSSLSYRHSYCGQKLSLAHSCSKWGVRFISSESTHGVVLMKEQGEIKHEVEMSLRNLLWSVGSQNTMRIKLDDSQQGQTHKTTSFLNKSWYFSPKMATLRPLRDISHILPSPFFKCLTPRLHHMMSPICQCV